LVGFNFDFVGFVAVRFGCGFCWVGWWRGFFGVVNGVNLWVGVGWGRRACWGLGGPPLRR